MSPVQVSCPACGAAIGFKIGSSMVTVCPYCRSVVARGDRKLEDLGKVAALVDTDSPLEVGLRGKWDGKPFEITGRAQLGHSAGGVWDEWYAAFPNDEWGWLAEAQGRFYLTFPQLQPAEGGLLPFDKLTLGQAVPVGNPPMRVAEKGRAKMLSAEGEIPYVLVPGTEYPYADLSGKGGTFGTIDYGDAEPIVYVGREVTLDDLGIPKSARKRGEPKQVEAIHVSCPQCGGALDLRAPDQTLRVGCPYCGALLDCRKGTLQLLQALSPPAVAPIIPIGTVGNTAEGPMTVIGMLQRSVTYKGVDYFWEEYLLYEPRIGFRWLVRSDDHWSFVKPVPPGEVSGTGQKRYYQDRTFKLFQKAPARVTVVIGEFYWKVSVGEVADTADYIAPPEMLSREIAAADASNVAQLANLVALVAPEEGEVNWSLGTYMTREEVETAFGVTGLPRPSTVGPNQPFLYKGIYPLWGGLTVVAGILALFFIILSLLTGNKVLEEQVGLDLVPPTATGGDFIQPAAFGGVKEGSHVVFREGISLKPRRNIQVRVDAHCNNTWLAVEGAFINDDTGEVQPFFVPVEYYSGVEGGESWSEGSYTNYTVLGALPAGTYTLRLEFIGEMGKAPAIATVRIDQGVPRWLHVFWLFGLLSIIPAAVLLYHWNFEHRRWQNSDFSSSG